jgi:hypothetical protein
MTRSNSKALALAPANVLPFALLLVLVALLGLLIIGGGTP